jgi:hypothetical protein
MDRKAEGVHATSADFLHYDQVDKKQRYHLAESAEDAFDESYEIRTCDLGRWLHGGPDDRRAFARDGSGGRGQPAAGAGIRSTAR